MYSFIFIIFIARRVIKTTTKADYRLVLVRQKQLSLLRLLQQNLLLLYYWSSSSRVMGLVCKQRVSFIRMLNGFSSGFSVLMWRRYSTTYKPGICTTAFWVVSMNQSGRRYFWKRRRVCGDCLQNDSVLGQAAYSCGRAPILNFLSIAPSHSYHYYVCFCSWW